MSWDARDYDGITFASEARERDEERETLRDEQDARMENFRAERCSYMAALRGGDEYAAEIRESLALEAQERRLVATTLIAKTFEDWRRAVTPATRVAAIGNGLFVRVGTGRKNRRAA
jgi:hypothetical protein